MKVSDIDCPECQDTGRVYSTTGEGPWNCYACWRGERLNRLQQLSNELGSSAKSEERYVLPNVVVDDDYIAAREATSLHSDSSEAEQ